MVIVPEVIVFQTVKAIIDLVASDYTAKADKTESLLYRILGNLQLQRYEFFEQAEAVFLRDSDNVRQLEVNMFFNTARASLPTIHITLPGETSGKDGLGIDQGYTDPLVDGDGNVTEGYTRRFDARYNVLITSENTNEVVLVYHVLRAMLISAFDHFSQSGLQNAKLSGQDLQINPQLVPEHIFFRGIGLYFEYEVNVPSLVNTEQIQSLIFNTGSIIESQVDVEN